MSPLHHIWPQVAANTSKKSCYIRLQDYVFDVTSFLTRHPGGELLLLQNAGVKDRAKVWACCSRDLCSCRSPAASVCACRTLLMLC